MKRYLMGATAVLGCLLAIGARTSTAANFDPSSESGFISRGDVISAGGKSALIPNPVVTYTLTMQNRLTCTWPDSTQRSTTLTSFLFRNYVADTRYSGNGTITGYFLSRDNEFNSDIEPPFFNEDAICWSLLGIADNGTPVQTDMTPLGSTSKLTFFGPSGPFDLDL
jgi:hypothetical protein